MNPSETAKKYLTRAVPSFNDQGVVTEWDLELSYTDPDSSFTESYSQVVNVASMGKVLAQWKNSDIISLISEQFDPQFDASIRAELGEQAL